MTNHQRSRDWLLLGPVTISALGEDPRHAESTGYYAAIEIKFSERSFGAIAFWNKDPYFDEDDEDQDLDGEYVRSVMKEPRPFPGTDSRPYILMIADSIETLRSMEEIKIDNVRTEEIPLWHRVKTGMTVVSSPFQLN